jgi:protein-tyrosine phosphatase
MDHAGWDPGPVVVAATRATLGDDVERAMLTSEPARHLALDGTRNVRDVGGYPAGASRRTRWRTLLRSDELTRLPEHAQQQLLDLGLRQVIDLRWPDELESSPNVFRRSHAVRYRSLPLLADDPTPHVGLGGMYRHVFDERSHQLAEVVRALLEEDGVPAIIGCAAGKDRTGVTIALLLDVVGVPTDLIVEDYAMSAGFFASPVTRVEDDDWRHEPLVVDSPPELMAGALEHLDREHGGARSLLRREGIGDADLDRLIEVLTEPVPASPMTGPGPG